MSYFCTVSCLCHTLWLALQSVETGPLKKVSWCTPRRRRKFRRADRNVADRRSRRPMCCWLLQIALSKVHALFEAPIHVVQCTNTHIFINMRHNMVINITERDDCKVSTCVVDTLHEQTIQCSFSFFHWIPTIYKLYIVETLL